MFYSSTVSIVIIFIITGFQSSLTCTHRYQDSCYKAYSTQHTFITAEAECQLWNSNYDNLGHLVSFGTHDEMEWVIDRLSPSFSLEDYIMTGLFEDIGVKYWNDGSDFDPFLAFDSQGNGCYTYDIFEMDTSEPCMRPCEAGDPCFPEEMDCPCGCGPVPIEADHPSFTVTSCDSYWDDFICEFEIPTCFGERATNLTVCSGRGECLGDDNCTCSSPYIGSDCAISICNGTLSTDSSVVCNGNGNCTNTDVCGCKTGFFGQFCSVWSCNGTMSNDTAHVCGGIGECVALDICSCLGGLYEEAKR